jgi:predicted outer membrane protein
MSVIKYTTLVLTLMCCSSAIAQQTSQQSPDQTRRAERVEERRDQISQNRDARQDNREDRQADRAADGRQLGDRIGTVLDSTMGNSMDEFIATCLLIGNQEEVALAKEAASRAQNENVKQFAQMLIDDHQKAIQKLQQHAKQGMSLDGAADVSVAVNSQGNQSSADQNSSSAQNSQIAANDSPTAQQYTANRVDIDANRDTMNTGTLDKVLKMNKQAAQECLSMTKSMMAEKQGAEFDKAFAGMQVGAHVGMLAKLKASQQHASPELASIIQESEQTVQRHLEQAKQLCQELESMQASNR